MSVKICNCGSGESSWWEHDARGIPLCRVCSRCRDEKLRRYRPEILTGYGEGDVDESIDPEDDLFNQVWYGEGADGDPADGDPADVW